MPACYKVSTFSFIVILQHFNIVLAFMTVIQIWGKIPPSGYWLKKGIKAQRLDLMDLNFTGLYGYKFNQIRIFNIFNIPSYLTLPKYVANKEITLILGWESWF